jgi:hypothetical protein
MLGCTSKNSRVTSTLHSLRASLDSVSAAPEDKPFEASDATRSDISVLVGLSREQIQSALGRPEACNSFFMPAPCEHVDDWFYSFYKLPLGWVGGGQELLLQFDRGGICTSASWRFTR